MTVEEVRVPKKIFDFDPSTLKKQPDKDTATYWADQAKAARARREFLEESKLSERISEPEAPPEPPFKIKGDINFGSFDLQEQQRKTQEDQERSRLEAQERVNKAEIDRDEARKALNEAQLLHIKSDLGGRIEQLQQAVAENNKHGIGEQLQSIEHLAGLLGYQKPVPGSSDNAMTLEIKRLEWQMKKEDRDFQRRMKQDERTWQIELKKLELQAKESEAKLRQERDKQEMFASAPERLGAIVAKGLMDPSNGDISAPAPAPRQTRQQYRAEAGMGEAGDVACPNCQTPIGIAPEAISAECVGCGSKVIIDRISQPAEPEKPVLA